MIGSALFHWQTRAVLRRNLTVYFRNWKSAVVAPMLEPLVYFLAFGMGLGVYIGYMTVGDRQVTYLNFVAPGILTYTFFSTSFFECLYGSFVRMFYQKTFEGILGTQVERVHIIWGEMAWGAIRATIFALGVSTILVAFNSAGLTDLALWRLLFLIPLGACSAMVFGGFALLFTAKVPNIEHMNYPVFLVGIPLSIISNTYFPLEDIHPWAAALAQVNPLFHLSRIFRHALLGGGFEPWIIVAVAVLLLEGLVISTIAHRWMDRRLEKEA